MTLNHETGGSAIYVATDIGLLEYTLRPGRRRSGRAPGCCAGQLYRWAGVRGLRLQTDAQIDDDSGEVAAIWRLVAEDPKLDLSADSDGVDDHAIGPMLAFARACIQHAG